MIGGLGPKKVANFRMFLSWSKLRITMKPKVWKYQLVEEEKSVHHFQFKPIVSGFKIRM